METIYRVHPKRPYNPTVEAPCCSPSALAPHTLDRLRVKSGLGFRVKGATASARLMNGNDRWIPPPCPSYHPGTLTFDSSLMSQRTWRERVRHAGLNKRETMNPKHEHVHPYPEPEIPYPSP